MSKKNTLSEEDRRLFQDAMKDVKPLSHVDNYVAPPPSVPVPQKIRSRVKVSEALLLLEPALETGFVEPVDAYTTLEFSRPGIQHRWMRRLKQGHFNMQATLDLHGLGVEKAQQTLQTFLSQAYAQNLKYVHIVHGKGLRSAELPLLKNSLNRWLRCYACVLAFCSATPRDGGTGAVYVLLQS